MESKPAGISLAQLLATKGLVVGAPTMQEMSQRASECKAAGRPMTVIYGETFDEGGNTIDSLKYYLFLSEFAKVVKVEFGIDVKATVLIADLGVYRNAPEEKEKMRVHAENRRAFAQKVKDTYHCDFDVVLMTDFVATLEFSAKLEKMRKLVFSNKALLDMIAKTVPEDRLEKERERGFSYSLDELTTILGLDVKVGPPREKLYDRMSDALIQHFDEKPLLCVYLYPTYPLGMQFGNYMSSQIIKTYGLTPYKVGSSGMSKNRVVVGITKPEELRQLITDSQLAASTQKPNPVLDIAITAQLAKQHLEGSFGAIQLYDDFYEKRISITTLKQLATDSANENILMFF